MIRLFLKCLNLFFITKIIIIISVDSSSSDWADPTDMLRYDSMTKTMKNQEIRMKNKEPIKTNVNKVTEIGEEQRRSENENPMLKVGVKQKLDKSTSTVRSNAEWENNSEFVFMTRHVKRLLRLLNIVEESSRHDLTVDVRITLSKYDIDVLRSYADSKGSIQDVESVLSGMMTVIKLSEADLNWSEHVKQAIIWENWSNLIQNNVFYVCAVICLMMLLRTLRASSGIGVLFKLFFVLFVTSIGWEWQFLYQKSKATTITEQAKYMNGCDPSSMTYFGWFTSFFSKDDPCYKHHEAFMVDSHWSVNPLFATSSVIAKAISTLSGGLGEGLGKFFAGYMSEFGFIEKYFMAIFALILAAVFIMYPITIAVKTIIMRPTIQPSQQHRIMVEDVKESVTCHCQPLRAPEMPHSPPVIQQHYHYYLTEKSIEKPTSADNKTLDELAISTLSASSASSQDQEPETKTDVERELKTETDEAAEASQSEEKLCST